MPNSYAMLNDPLQQGEAPHTARCNWKVLVLASLFISLGCVGIWSTGVVQNPESEEPMNAVALMPNMQAGKMNAMPSMAASAVQRMQPASNFRSMALPVQAAAGYTPPQAGYASFAPQFPSMSMPVNAVQDSLKTYGVRSSPFEKLALAQIASTRDVSMKAQVRKEYSNLDPADQAVVQKLSKAVVVRAMTLEKEKMAGITAPMGFWDPLKISANIDGSTLYFFREIEIKHGRVGMLAAAGILVAEKFHPLYGAESDWTNAALYHHTNTDLVEKFWPAVLVAAGIAELLYPQNPDKLPGDLGWDPLGFKPTSESELMELQNKELNNGRLAMLAAAGMMAEEVIYGKLSI